MPPSATSSTRHLNRPLLPGLPGMRRGARGASPPGAPTCDRGAVHSSPVCARPNIIGPADVVGRRPNEEIGTADLVQLALNPDGDPVRLRARRPEGPPGPPARPLRLLERSEEHTSELQSRVDIV